MLALENHAGTPGRYFIMYPYSYHADKLPGKTAAQTRDNIDLNVYINSLRVAFVSRGFSGNICYLGLIQPVGRIEMMGDSDEGIGDMELVAGQWLIEDRENELFLALACGIFFPTGSYDQNSAANLGTNDYRFRPILQFAKQFGKFDYEFDIKYQWHTENPDTHRRAGDDILFESYMGYFLLPNVMCGVHFDAFFSDDARLNGRKINGSATEKYQAGPSATWVVAKGFVLDAQMLFDFNAQNTTEGYTVQFRFVRGF